MIDLLLLVEQKEREELKGYEYLKEQGLLLKLPCKIGDMIYEVGEKCVIKNEVEDYHINEDGIAAVRVSRRMEDYDCPNVFRIEDFGKSVFSTKEEAEAALRKNKECD